MKAGISADVRRACAELLAETSGFYGTPICGVRVLAARPLRVREHWATELFGDYNPQTMLIRLWMRTTVRKEITSLVQGNGPELWSPAATATGDLLGSCLSHNECCRAARLKHRLRCAARGGLRLRPLQVKEV
jgi:hypothetical protein